RADEQVVVRDLLCHRIGFASMTMLWYSLDITPQEVLEASLRAELLHPFREKWNYSNISFLAAGEAAGRAAGSNWHDMMAERMFRPLGMTSSNTSRDAARADSRMARGYMWRAKTKELVHQPMRDVAAVAPAGAINSNVRDMAQWVRFQLARGAIDGRRLLSEAQHAETWRTHSTVGGDVDYGLGWFLRTWRGKRVIEHAGGIDGFTAEVAMLPDEQIGFVLLMNLFAAPLQDASRQIVFETLLDDDLGEAEDGDKESFEPFLGKYAGNFGQFKGATFEVLVQNDRLAIDVPGQMIFELHQPDEDGKRSFVITDQIALRFNRDDQDKVRSLTLFQSGYEFELPREGVELPIEIDLDAARELLGSYHSGELDADVHVVLRNNRLAVDVPGQMVFELHPPDEQGRCVFRVKDSLWVRFDRDDQGQVTSMTMNQEGRESVLARTAEADAPLPTVAEVMAMVHEAHGSSNLPSLGDYRAQGSVRWVHIGVEGELTTTVADTDRYRQDFEMGRFGRINAACAGDMGWLDSVFMGVMELDGDLLEDSRRQHPLALFGDWTAGAKNVSVLREEQLEGVRVLVVSIQPASGPAETLRIDADTGLVVAASRYLATAVGQRIPTEYRFSDYRPVEGVQLPFRIESSNDISGRMVMQYERIDPDPDYAATLFDKPSVSAALTR
ncbi:MAG: serine hydrolase, partial [Planctomycetota bacterium]